MYMKKINIILIFVLVCCFSNVYAQNSPKQEVSVFGSFGLSTLKYSMKGADRSNKAGGSFGVNYNYYFNDKLSLRTGLEASFYKSKLHIGNISDRYETNDGEYDFIFQTNVSGYEETQNVVFISLPVQIQYEIPVTSQHKFYVAIGPKFALPVSKKFEMNETQLENMGYYPHLGIPVTEPEFMGFGNFKRNNIKGDFDLKMSIMASLEAGIKWSLSGSKSLYTGIYCDYGINNIKKTNDKHFVGYNTADPENFIFNGALSSKFTDAGSGDYKINPIAVGGKVSLSFTLK